MKIILKTVKGDQFAIETEPTLTILELKKKIEELKNLDYTCQRLILRGTQLSDEKTVSEIGLIEGEFLIVMVVKKAQPQAQAQPKPIQQQTYQQDQSHQQPQFDYTATQVPQQVHQQQHQQHQHVDAAQFTATQEKPNVIQQPYQPAQQQATANVNVNQQQSTFDQGASNLVHGAQLEETIKMIEGMGFERTEIVKALRAAFNNPDRAIDYLINGIPAHLLQQTQPQAQPQQQPSNLGAGGNLTATRVPGGHGGATGATGGLPMPGLQGQYQPLNAQFNAAANVGVGGGNSGGAAGGVGSGNTGAGAHTGQGVGGNVGGGGPLDFLAQNPMFQQLRASILSRPELLQSLLQNLAQANPGLYQVIQNNQEEFMRILQEPAGGDGQGAHPPGTIAVTLEEKEAIDRLQALGFQRQQAIEAFLICDRNENLAANYLFDTAMNQDFQDEPVFNPPQGHANVPAQGNVNPQANVQPQQGHVQAQPQPQQGQPQQNPQPQVDHTQVVHQEGKAQEENANKEGQPQNQPNPNQNQNNQGSQQQPPNQNDKKDDDDNIFS